MNPPLADARRSHRLFEAVLKIAADAIITVDAQYRIVHFNRGAEQLFGWYEHEVDGLGLEALIPDRFRSAHREHLSTFGVTGVASRHMADRRPVAALRKDGSEFLAEASISRVELDDGVLYAVVLRDISARVRAEENDQFLARASAALGASLDFEGVLGTAVHVGVPYLAECAVLDVIERSGAVRRIASVHDDASHTQRLKELAGQRAGTDDDPFPVRTALATGAPAVGSAPWGGTTTERNALQQLGATASLSIPLRIRERDVGVLTLLTDNRARLPHGSDVHVAVELGKRIAAAIDNAWLYRDSIRAGRARDELLGIVSHDLRNPLSAISMCARVLQQHEPEDKAARQDLVSAVLDSAALMQRLIQDLLDVATVESGSFRVFPEEETVPKFVERAIAVLRNQAAQRGVALNVVLEHDLPEVMVDAIRMEQVIANLVGNAVKFTDSGGTVTVRATAEPRHVLITVEDTGVGIPQASLPHIFDRFWHSRRSRTAGTGLGLAIAKGIVEMHGGTLQVESEVGVGTKFWFRVPRTEM